MRENSLRKYELGTLNAEKEKRKTFSFRNSAFGILLLSLLIVALLSVGIGAVEISPFQVLAIGLHKIGITSLPFSIEFSEQQESVLWAIRLPRLLLGLLVGAGLAVSGAVLQSLFRNPLADPTLIGVSSGAALAISVTIVVGERMAISSLGFGKLYFLPFAAFFGGLMATLLIYRLGKRAQGTNVTTMLLAGIAVNAFAFAGIGFCSFIASDAQLRNISFWNLGSVGGATWQMLIMVTPLIVISIFFLIKMARSFNVMLLGEDEARHLGVNIERLKWQAICLVALAVGAAVAVSGTISFVGLVVPHLLRLTSGADHRYLLKNSALLGANLIVGADILARTVLSPAELPIGIVTAFIGAPFFIWLLLRNS